MFPRFAVGLGYIVALLLIGLFFVGVHFMSGTVPKYTGSASVTGVSGPIQIDRDEYAIPHIHAATERDAYFGYGYAEAQDRLFQMEFTRRIGQGRLSEIVGKKSYTVDAWAKTVGFARLSEQMWSKTTPHTREILTAFTNGINQYIDANHTQLGFEFDALKLIPEHWKPQDCLIIGRLMAWEMNFSYFTDAAFGDIALALDTAHMKWLYPDYPADGATVLEGANPASFVTNIATLQAAAHAPTPAKTIKTNTTQKHTGAAITKQPTVATPPTSPTQQPHPAIKQPQPHLPPPPPRIGALNNGAEFFAEFQAVEKEIDKIIGSHSAGGGSNSFAVGPSRTKSGGAILENDTHLDLRAPARWYLAHITSDDGLNVAGFAIPGLPAILSGRNQNISWGITNGMADESDFYVEALDSTGTRYIAPNGTTQKFSIVYDSIRVQDSVKSNPFQVYSFPVRLTLHGPIMSDIHPFRLTRSFENDKRAGGIPDTSFLERSRPVALTWNGLYALTDEIGCFLDLARAKTIPEARSGMQGFATPCLNLCLADASGNIAYQYIGRLPKRSGNEQSIMLPRDGTKMGDLWTGFTTLTEMPSTANPPQGYIVSANNPPTRNRSIPYSNNWEPSARADRISELIETGGKIDTASVRAIMTDVISPYDMRRVLPYLLALYPDPHPPRITPDSSSLYHLDSLAVIWKEDSIKKHTTITDSAFALIRSKDSAYLITRRSPEDTITSPKIDAFTAQVLSYLRNWDGGMRTEEIAPTIYAVFLQRLIENTFLDELGSERYKEFTYMDNTPLRTLERILPDSTNIWWDNVLTNGPAPETRDSIINISFHDALRILARTFGRDIRQWQWGQLHTLTYRHPFSASSATVARLANIEGGPTPGGYTTVMQGSYTMWNPYEMHVGPSMRMVADMKTNVLLAALPTGNSEAVFGDNYRDMVALFKAGELIPISLTEHKDTWKHFELQPK